MNGPWRGTKGTLFEGGHRVPFLVRWPAAIKPGGTSSQLLGLVDLPAPSPRSPAPPFPPGRRPTASTCSRRCSVRMTRSRCATISFSMSAALPARWPFGRGRGNSFSPAKAGTGKPPGAKARRGRTASFSTLPRIPGKRRTLRRRSPQRCGNCKRDSRSSARRRAAAANGGHTHPSRAQFPGSSKTAPILSSAAWSRCQSTGFVRCSTKPASRLARRSASMP